MPVNASDGYKKTSFCMTKGNRVRVPDLLEKPQDVISALAFYSSLLTVSAQQHDPHPPGGASFYPLQENLLT